MQAQIKEWIACWMSNKADWIRIARCWIKKKHMLAKKDERKKLLWARGLIAALILSLQRIGWEPTGPSRWKDPRGVNYQIECVDLEELMIAVAEDTKKWLWKKAGQHYLG